MPAIVVGFFDGFFGQKQTNELRTFKNSKAGFAFFLKKILQPPIPSYSGKKGGDVRWVT